MDDPHRDVLYHYYAARASVYDAGYAGPPEPWVNEMVQALQTALRDRQVLELACGTGHWTGYAAEVAWRVTATDIAPTMLARAHHKLRAYRNVTVVDGDAYDLDRIAGDYTAGLAMQWFSHIPKAQVAGFLAHWHARLGPRAVIFLGDNQRRADDQDPLVTLPGDPNTYEIRTLPDGSQYTIVKNYYTADELRAVFASVADDLRITIGRRWWWLSYTIARPAGDAPAPAIPAGVAAWKDVRSS